MSPAEFDNMWLNIDRMLWEMAGVLDRPDQFGTSLIFKVMKRVGFTVCQMAGSYVRFDPPAKLARPIHFYRVSLASIYASRTSWSILSRALTLF